MKDFIKLYDGGRVDRDGKFGFQCNDLTRKRLDYIKKPQYKPLGANGVKNIALNPSLYLVNGLIFVKNNKKDPNQVPKQGDIVIFSQPTATGHIAIVVEAKQGEDLMSIFEQNGGKGSTTGLGSDACRIVTKTYKHCMGWITFSF